MHTKPSDMSYNSNEYTYKQYKYICKQQSAHTYKEKKFLNNNGAYLVMQN